MFNHIIRNYLIKEVFKTFLAVFTVVFLILLSTQVLRVLSAVSDGKITLDLMFLLLGLTNIKSMAMVVPIVLYLSIILALSRLYKDSEIVAMWSCGISPKTILLSLMPIFIVFVMIEFTLAIYISPWANAQITNVKKVVASNADVDLLEPGRFNSFSGGDRVIYAEKVLTGKNLERIFLQLRQKNNTSVIYAQKASVEENEETGARYVIFKQGTRYDGEPGSDEYRIIKFKEYAVLIEDKSLKPIKYDWDEMRFDQLLKSNNRYASAELQWRISLVLSLFVLSMIAIPISQSSPRKGRFAKLLPAIFVYFLYTNFLGVAQSFIKKGELPSFIGLWWVHIIFLALFIYLFGQQMGWFQLSKRSRNFKNSKVIDKGI